MPVYPTYDGRTPLTKEVVNAWASQAQRGTRRTAGTGLTANDMGSLGASYAPDRTRTGHGIWALLTASRDNAGIPAGVTTFTWKEVIRNADGTHQDHPYPLTGDFDREPAVERLNREVSTLEPVFLRRFIVDLTAQDNHYPPWLVNLSDIQPPLPVFWLFDANNYWEWAELADVIPPTTFPFFVPGSFSWHQVNMPGGVTVPGGETGPPRAVLPASPTITSAGSPVHVADTYLVRYGRFNLFSGNGRYTNQFRRNWSNAGGNSNTFNPGNAFFQYTPFGDPFYTIHPGVDLTQVFQILIPGTAGLNLPAGGSVTDVAVGVTATVDFSGVDPSYNPGTGRYGPFPLSVNLVLVCGSGTSYQETLIIDTQEVYAPRVVRLAGSIPLQNLLTGSFYCFAPLVRPPDNTLWMANTGGIIYPPSSGQFWMKYTYPVQS